MKYKEGQTVILRLGFYDEYDRKYIPKNAEGHIINVMPVLDSYQVDFYGHALVLVPEEMIDLKLVMSQEKN